MKGQTIVEYVIVTGIIAIVLYAMGPAFKRGTQSLIKGTADQLAAQQNADQDFTAGGSHLETSTENVKTNQQRATREQLYTSNMTVNESTATKTSTQTNMGFTAQ